MSQPVTGLYPDYAAALAVCGAGYEDAVLTEIIARKVASAIKTFGTLEITADHTATTLLAVSTALSAVSARPLRVLDLGGGCGLHYFTALWFWRAPLRWAVVESPAMAARGAAQFGDDSLSFHASIDDAERALGAVDLVHFSGSLQYLPDPRATLARLCTLRAPYLLLARFPAWTGPAIVAVQPSRLADHGAGNLPPGIQDRDVPVPITFLNAHESLGALVPAYDIMLALQSADTFTIQGNTIGSLTFLMRAKP